MNDKAPEIQEVITLLSNKTAYNKLGGERHFAEDYIVTEDATDPDTKERFITLKLVDKREVQKKVKELVSVILSKIGETKSKALRGLITDVLQDYTPLGIEKLYKKVVLEDKEVKPRPGCFKLVVGDARRNDSDEIMLRE